MNALRPAALMIVMTGLCLAGTGGTASAAIAYWTGDWETELERAPQLGSSAWGASGNAVQIDVDMPPQPDWRDNPYSDRADFRVSREFEVVGESTAYVLTVLEFYYGISIVPRASASASFSMTLYDQFNRVVRQFWASTPNQPYGQHSRWDIYGIDSDLAAGAYRLVFGFQANVGILSFGPPPISPPDLSAGYFASIRGVATVPEPSSLLGLGTGLAMAGAWGMRRRRQRPGDEPDCRARS